MKKLRDSQRSKVYEWEKPYFGFFRSLNGDLRQCENIAKEMAARYAIAAPTITDGRARRTGCYHAETHQIRLPKHARHRLYVLHECAHMIVDKCWSRIDSANAPHGARFVGTYLHLVGYYDCDLQSAMRLSAVRYGIKFDKDCSPKAFRSALFGR